MGAVGALLDSGVFRGRRDNRLGWVSSRPFGGTAEYVGGAHHAEIMIKFSRPSSLRLSLLDTYDYLIGQLELLLGYPASIHTIPGVDAPKTLCHRTGDGSLQLALPSSDSPSNRSYLILSPPAARDRFCRRIASQFLRMCSRIATESKHSWDIKALLIREEQFLWDNAILSVTYSGNQKYNALDLLAAARDNLLFRYEHNPVAVGILATWNWHSLRPKLEALGCTVLKVRRRFDLPRTAPR